MAIYFDQSINRYRDSESGQFASADAVATAIKDGFEQASQTTQTRSTDPAIVALLRSIEAQLKSLNKSTKAQTEQVKRQQSILTGIARSSRKLRSSLGAYEMAIALAATVAICLYANLSSPADSVINKVLGTDFQAQIKEGDTIVGYEITSGYGPRDAPIEDASTDHKGVDAGTPVGTTIYMVGEQGSVECKDNPGGYGTYAVIQTVFDGKPIAFLAAHLSRCSSGQYKAGQVIAKTGNTGNSTAPHLHWEQHENDIPVPPTKGWLIWALTGNNVVGSAGDAGKQDLVHRILKQESGGNPSAVNPDSGALGKYQVMPENIAPWSQECLGRSISKSDFMAHPQQQDQIANCKLGQYFDRAKSSGESDYEACRSAAATWYSGQPSLKNSTAPQSGYPSIRAYTEQVCGGF